MLNNLTPTVKILLLINIAAFILSGIFPFIMEYGSFYNPLLNFEGEGVMNPNFKPWQLITYMFLHGGVGHIFSNMFGLFIFGSSLEHFMGSKKFLTYYLLTGVGAAIIYSFWNYFEMSELFTSFDSIQSFVDNKYGKMVGASGALFGILVAYGVLFPNTELMLLFFPFPIKAKYFVLLYGLYELYAGFSGSEGNVAHLAHVGGLITGFILLKFFNFDKRFR